MTAHLAGARPRRARGGAPGSGGGLVRPDGSGAICVTVTTSATGVEGSAVVVSQGVGTVEPSPRGEPGRSGAGRSGARSRGPGATTRDESPQGAVHARAARFFFGRGASRSATTMS